MTSSCLPPLKDLQVLDFTTLLSGSLTSLILAEAGAKVIKIEGPGDDGEGMAGRARVDRGSSHFALLNRGKKSLAIDLNDPRARALLEPLIARADIVLEQFHPGVMEQLGLGYEAVSRINPRIVYCSLSGYGQAGPKGAMVGHGLNHMAECGLLALGLNRHRSPVEPVAPPVPIAEIAGGTYPAMVNILLALLRRERTDLGCHLDIAVADNLFMLMSDALGQGLATGRFPTGGEGVLTGGSPRYRIYPTADGKFLAAAPIGQEVWEKFCTLINLPQAFRDDSKNAAAIIPRVCDIIIARESEHWRRVFYGEECCCSVVKTLEEAINDESFGLRGIFRHRLVDEKGEEMPALPVSVAPQFRDDPGKVKSVPPLGGHNDEFLKRGINRT
ncbi:MAG: CoA transferase [Hyphomicrobiales bacterium]